MTWFGWLLIGTYVAGSLVCIARVGQAREPITPIDAVAATAFSGLLICGILFVGTGSV